MMKKAQGKCKWQAAVNLPHSSRFPVNHSENGTLMFPHISALSWFVMQQQHIIFLLLFKPESTKIILLFSLKIIMVDLIFKTQGWKTSIDTVVSNKGFTWIIMLEIKTNCLKWQSSSSFELGYCWKLGNKKYLTCFKCRGLHEPQFELFMFLTLLRRPVSWSAPN